METTKVVCNKEFQIDRVDSRLFGSFLEHMGRVIYSGDMNLTTRMLMKTALGRM